MCEREGELGGVVHAPVASRASRICSMSLKGPPQPSNLRRSTPHDAQSLASCWKYVVFRHVFVLGSLPLPLSHPAPLPSFAVGSALPLKAMTSSEVWARQQKQAAAPRGHFLPLHRRGRTKQSISVLEQILGC